MERPTKKYSVGQAVISTYQGEEGEIKKIDWSVTFGQWTYMIERTKDSRYDNRPKGTEVWICESDLKPKGTT